jgi:hypothetical protein
MDPVFPQLLRFGDVALLCLRLIVAAVFYGWHYDLTFLIANLVILTTGGGRLVL